MLPLLPTPLIGLGLIVALSSEQFANGGSYRIQFKYPQRSSQTLTFDDRIQHSSFSANTDMPLLLLFDYSPTT
jgi:hypothetical protein